MRRKLKRLLTPVLLVVATIFFATEELLWRFAAFFALLGRLPVLRLLERAITRLPPYGALVLFALPALALVPVKLLALYWLAGGHPALGVGAIVAAKIVGTALVARIYQLTRLSLIKLEWFSWSEQKVLGWRAAAHEIWRRLPLVRWIERRWRGWRERGRTWLARRWRAIRRRR